MGLTLWVWQVPSCSIRAQRLFYTWPSRRVARQSGKLLCFGKIKFWPSFLCILKMDSGCWKGTRLFGSSQWQIFGSKNDFLPENVFQVRLLQTVFHFFKAIFDTSFRLLGLFFGESKWFVQMVDGMSGWNLPEVLTFVTISQNREPTTLPT